MTLFDPAAGSGDRITALEIELENLTELVKNILKEVARHSTYLSDTHTLPDELGRGVGVKE